MEYYPEDERMALFRGSEEQISDLWEAAQDLGIMGVVTDVHIDYNQLSPQERERQERFDAPFHTLVVPSVMKNAQQLTNRLRTNGIQTVRDVLVLGKQRLNHGTALITAVQLAKIEQGMALNFPDETFHDKPSVDDIAAICIGVDQVHGGVLPAYTRYIKQRKSRLLQEGRDDLTPPHFKGIEYYFAGLRVGEFLTNKLFSPPPAYQGRKPSNMMPEEVFKTIRAEALPFGFAFSQARQKTNGS